jgi:membrane carboxypeptidase/penicillin-binding protein
VETRELWKKILWAFNVESWIRKIKKFNDSQNSSRFRFKKNYKFFRNLGIYDKPEELLSISLGSAETTLLKLTSAYSVFVNGGKLVDPILIDRIQDSEGKTILIMIKENVLIVMKFHT